MDYIKDLTPEEQEWLNKFVKEYYDGNVPKKATDNLHASDELRRDCYHRKNCQNRDLLSVLDSGGKMLRVMPDRDKKDS